MIWGCVAGLVLLYLVAHVYFERYLKKERVQSTRGVLLYIGAMFVVMASSAGLLIFGNI